MKIKKFIQKLISPIAPNFGLYVEKGINRNQLLQFLQKIHPIHSGKDLIRIGPGADGGYLVPDDLEGIAACFSPGVDIESRFELQLAERGMQVFMADYSVDGPAAPHANFHFEKKYLAAYDAGHLMTMDSWINAQTSLDPSADLILQMDIEGAEYEVLQSTSTQAMKRFRIIVMEFHGWHHLYKREVFQKVEAAITKLLQTHAVVHIHPNNDGTGRSYQGIELHRWPEISFIRRDRISNTYPVTTLPHALDHDNVPKKSIPLSPDWYSRSEESRLKY